jgi:hypothetical protein
MMEFKFVLLFCSIAWVSGMLFGAGVFGYQIPLAWASKTRAAKRSSRKRTADPYRSHRLHRMFQMAGVTAAIAVLITAIAALAYVLSPSEFRFR